jgi:hypothetical protein
VPLGVSNSLGGAWLEVIAVDDQWEVAQDVQWFLDPVDRRYFRVTLENGQQITIYRTTVHGGWHKAARLEAECTRRPGSSLS